MIKKTITSLFLGLFIFSCSDLQDAAKTMKDVSKNQEMRLNKLNVIEKKMTSSDISEAQRLARECMKKNCKGC